MAAWIKQRGERLSVEGKLKKKKKKGTCFSSCLMLTVDETHSTAGRESCGGLLLILLEVAVPCQQESAWSKACQLSDRNPGRL